MQNQKVPQIGQMLRIKCKNSKTFSGLFPNMPIIINKCTHGEINCKIHWNSYILGNAINPNVLYFTYNKAFPKFDGTDLFE